jgi:hypothetical protein
VVGWWRGGAAIQYQVLSLRRWLLVFYHYGAYIELILLVLFHVAHPVMIGAEVLNVQILDRSILNSASTETTKSMSLYRALINVLQGLLYTNRDRRGDIESSLICLIILLLDS